MQEKGSVFAKRIVSTVEDVNTVSVVSLTATIGSGVVSGYEFMNQAPADNIIIPAVWAIICFLAYCVAYDEVKNEEERNNLLKK